eukprot:scaffold1487_cov116-Isochrysis_galbana.AAC.23
MSMVLLAARIVARELCCARSAISCANPRFRPSCGHAWDLKCAVSPCTGCTAKDTEIARWCYQNLF